MRQGGMTRPTVFLTWSRKPGHMQPRRQLEANGKFVTDRRGMIAASHSAAKACSVCWSIWSRCSEVLPVTLA
jgi:hypothetical protein